jgi:hypothetical protein
MRYFKKLKGKRIYLSPINIEDVEQYTQRPCPPPQNVPLSR